MALVSSPYGLKPVNAIGSGSYNGGTIREIKVSTNNTAGIFAGDIIVLSAAGVPSAATSTPTAGTTAGIIGVCVGVRYVDPTMKYALHAQYLPANAITNGYTDVWVKVNDDPNQIYQIQGSAAFGTLTNGADGAVGKNAAFGNFSAGSTSTGNSGVNLVVGANGGSLANTATLAARIVGYVAATASDTYPEILIKFNQGVHSYQFATGV